MEATWGAAMVRYADVKRERDEYRRQLDELNVLYGAHRVSIKCPHCKVTADHAVQLSEYKGDEDATPS